MGYKLRRWLADRLPAGLSTGERLVALEIADQANDDTRRAYGKDLLEIVVRRTGYADDKQLGKVLGKLAAHGIELRAPVRDKQGRVVRDSRGRTLFACHGHELSFLIPTEESCPALMVPPPGELERSPERGSNAPEGPPVGPEGPPPGAGSSPAWSSKVPPAGDPIPQSPQEDSSSLSGLERRIVDAVGATAEEAREIISLIEKENHPRSLAAYVSTLAANGDLAALLERVRAGCQKATTRQAVADLGGQPLCAHGVPGGDRPHPSTGRPFCPICRARVTPAPAPCDAPPEVGRPRLIAAGSASQPGVQHTAADPPDGVQAARAYLNRRGDFFEWMTAAQARLGDAAAAHEVILLAAELAQQAAA